ncbi:nucleotidyltransferase domain-containing protein [Microbacteriaceae bacterium VKM Ac-2854]|nr:nucleotidyltransferase domain-containing protein [Microbacteriaceae bacterium VKM Ac-2854]
MDVILSGVVGSTAHGLAGPQSDLDRAGVFLIPTRHLLGFDRPAETVVTTDPDASFHELEKFLRLALKANPSVLELLWLPEHDARTPLGDELVGLRDSLLSERAVRAAFLGYADAQQLKLLHRQQGDAGPMTGRALKHARHILRLLEQGRELLAGTMSVAVRNPAFYRDVLPTLSFAQFEALRDEARRAFEATPSALPEHPDSAGVEAWLIGVRLRSL